jgi:hypothetical protein
MKGYVENFIWQDLEITKPRTLWVAERLLRIPPELIAKHRRGLPSLIYRVFFSLEAHENEYITKYNAARADLVVNLINYGDTTGPAIHIDSEPSEDISYWLCSHVLGFTDMEIAVLCNIDIDAIHQPGRDLLPLVKSAYVHLKLIKFRQDPLMQHFHRSRHLMIKHYLDVVYHEL